MTEDEKKRLLELLADVEAELSLETIDEADEESHALQVGRFTFVITRYNALYTGLRK